MKICSNERFRSVEGDGFPAVSSYDYVTNLYTRGIENRVFRWEDVKLEGSYLFTEVTSSGSLEDNSITFTSGVMPLTSPDVGGSYFDGWTLSGGTFWAVGLSGGNFQPTNSTVAPITEDAALIIWATGEDSSIETLNNYTNTTGTNPGILEFDKLYQVFFNAKALSGDGYLNCYIEGYNAGSSIINYYDPHSSAWTTTRPTGRFSIDSNKYDFVRFDFRTNSFTGGTPNSYKLRIEQTTGNSISPILIDDIHIDRYQKKNAFIDYLIPTGYLIQISPDLGWHNTFALFEGTQINPHLYTFGPYSISQANLTDNLDNTVQCEITESDFASALSKDYTKYLWRAVPLSPNGSLTLGGHPARFRYIGQILTNDFQIDDFEDDELNPVKVFTGKRNKRLSILIDGEEHPNTEYPTDNSWKVTINLASAERRIAISARDTGGATTTPFYYTLKVKSYQQAESSVWNAFDEHGVLMDIKRIPREDNESFRERIKDVVPGSTSPIFRGIVNTASRELGLTRIENALTLIPAKNRYNYKRNSIVQLEVTSYSLRIRNSEMIRTETKKVDPVYNYVVLDKLPNGLPISINFEGVTIKESLISRPDPFYDFEPDIYKVHIKDPKVYGKAVSITYEYFEELFFQDYPSLGLLLNKIKQVKDNAGNSIVSIQLNEFLSGSENCRGLYKDYFEISNTDEISLSWSPIILNKISDNKFIRYYTRTVQDPRKSKAYEYVKELKSKSRILWGFVEADRDFWDAASSNDEGLASFPIQTDPQLSYIYTQINQTPQNGRISRNILPRNLLVNSNWSSSPTIGTATATNNSDGFSIGFNSGNSGGTAYKQYSFTVKANTWYAFSVRLKSIKGRIGTSILGVSPAPYQGDRYISASYFDGAGRYVLIFKYLDEKSVALQMGMGISAQEVNTVEYTLSDWMLEELTERNTPVSEYSPPSLDTMFSYQNNNTVSNNKIIEKKGENIEIDIPKVLTLIGDSFSDEQTDIPFLVKDYSSEWVVQPHAFSGRALSQAKNFIQEAYDLSELEQSIGSIYKPKFNQEAVRARYFMALMGINDILVSNNTATQIASSAQEFINTCLTIEKNAIILLATIPPFGSSILASTTKEAIRQEYNAWVYSFAASRKHIFVYDIANLLEDPSSSDTLNAVYDVGDGVHLNTLGKNAAARKLAEVLDYAYQNTLFQSSQPATTKIFDAVAAWARNYTGYSNEIMKNIGLDYKFFQPGVAHTNDLTPEVFTTFSLTNSLENDSSPVGPTRNNNTDPIFSGQR